MLNSQKLLAGPAPVPPTVWTLGLLFFALAATPQVALAQTGSLEEREIVVEKSRTNELPPASRNFDKLTIPPPPPVKHDVRYAFRDFKLGDRPLVVNPRVAPLRQEASAPVAGVYIEAGFGNYVTPYGRLGAHTKPSDKYRAGLDVRHQSSLSGPIDDKNSAGGSTAAIAEGEIFGRTVALGARAGFEYDDTHFYGYAREAKERYKNKEDSLRQAHTRVNAELTFRTTDPHAPFQSEINVGVRHWESRLSEQETDAYGKFNFLFGLDATNRFAVRGEGSYLTYESVVKQTRPFGQATLAYEHDGDRVDVSLGATAGYTGDTLNKAKQFNVYPAVRLSLEVVEDRLLFFAGASGGLERTTLYNLTKQNPWLAKSMLEAEGDSVNRLGVPVADVNHQLAVFGGLSGSPARGVRVLGRGSYNLYRNLYFFNPRVLDSARYELTYADNDSINRGDQQVKNINIHGEITVDLGQKLQLALKGDADTWSADFLKQPYHRPSFSGSLTATVNLMSDKLQISPEAYVIGSAYGLGGIASVDDTGKRQLRKTDTVVDLNLRVDYRITSQFRIFALGQNLTGQNYQRFLNYPVRGLTFIGGLGYQF